MSSPLRIVPKVKLKSKVAQAFAGSDWGSSMGSPTSSSAHPKMKLTAHVGRPAPRASRASCQ